MQSSSERVLIITYTQRDAESTRSILSSADIACEICRTLKGLESELKKGAGALLLAKEVLNGESVNELANLLNKQPSWSFLPVILLISAGDLNIQNESTLQLLKPLRN